MNPTTFLGGLLLGLGSSLHCAGMCGAIASSLTLGLAKAPTVKAQARTLILAQGGKAVAYTLAGALLGAVGASIYGLFDRSAAYLVLRWLGACGLVWIGLSLLGLAPAFRGPERLFAPVRRWAWSARRAGDGAAVLAGLVWGLLPCGMVYSALMFALVAGSAAGGAAVMLGFGLGVMPAVTATALGVSRLPQLARGRIPQVAIGLALIAVGLATLVWPMGGAMTHCDPPRAHAPARVASA